MDGYDLQRSVRPFVEFIEKLTNWYVRRSRRRFWKSQDDDDKLQAYRTLYHVLLEFSKIAAPFIPFVAEAIYRNLRAPGMPESVHLCDFPSAQGRHRDAALEAQMDWVMTVVAMGRQLRAANDLKVRQPLAALHVVCRDRARLAAIQPHEEMILDELNVKQVIYDADETALALLRAKPDFKRLGPRLGPKVKAAAQAIAALPGATVAALAGGVPTSVVVVGETVALAPEDVLIERQPRPDMVVASEGDLIVGLDTKLNDDLLREGLAREFVNKVQNMRKAADFEVTQRIAVTFHGDAAVRDAVRAHADYIRTEVLALECQEASGTPAGAAEWDLNGHPATLAIRPLADRR
jgi:isoleucyl-tRNA synthetase